MLLVTAGNDKIKEGQYILLEFGRWHIGSLENLFEVSLTDDDVILLMKDGVLVPCSSNEEIKVEFDIKRIGKEEKLRAIEAYRQWKFEE